MLVFFGQSDIGAWCNGSIHALGACSSGSNPGAPTNKTAFRPFLVCRGAKMRLSIFRDLKRFFHIFEQFRL